MGVMGYFCQPRSGNTFPTTVGGKAFDVGLIMAWLEDDLAAASEAMSCHVS